MLPLLGVTSVAHAYGGRPALAPVTFSVQQEQCVGVVGPNGSGKTTLLRMAAGLIRPREGRIERWEPGDPPRYYGGEATLPPRAAARRWARVVAGVAIGEARRIGRLSRGTRQMIGLRVALAVVEPALFLLDEPWEGLDPEASHWLTVEVLRLKDSRSGLLISSHRLHDMAGVCDSYLFLGGATPRWIDARELHGGGGAALAAAFERWRRG